MPVRRVSSSLKNLPDKVLLEAMGLGVVHPPVIREPAGRQLLSDDSHVAAKLVVVGFDDADGAYKSAFFTLHQCFHMTLNCSLPLVGISMKNAVIEMVSLESNRGAAPSTVRAKHYGFHLSVT
ncbi:hypothetical protein F2264_21555 [Salmonella enterica]|nr:hypothetical protein [Salmonella enterica]EAO3601661.1 hypothetical protein [Salmonella enterica]ECC2205742.1 hypothetical protein [Salmonella enterica]ECU5200754.1 hypothetical protein [Salmonella enterica]